MWRGMIGWIAVALLALVGPAHIRAAPQVKPSVSVGVVANVWTVELLQWVALQKGYFAQEGFRDVKVPTVSPASTMMAAVLSGSMDFTVNLSDDTIFRAVDRGGDVPRIIAGYFNEHTYGLFVRPEARTAADLRGKIIGTDQPGGTIDVMSREALKYVGLDPDRDVRLVPVGNAPQRATALLGGSVAGVMGSLTDDPRFEANGIRLLLDMRKVYPQYEFGSLSTTKMMTGNYPETVTAFLRAMIRAMRYVHEAKPAELAAIIKASGGDVSEYFAKELAIWLEAVPSDGRVNLAGLQVLQRREQAAGRISSKFDYRTVLELRFLRQAWKDLGIR